MDWRELVLIAVIGVCISLVSGFVENSPEASVFVHKYYGWPLVWRITTIFSGEEYRYFELFIDCLFWFFVTAVVYLVVKKVVKG